MIEYELINCLMVSPDKLDEVLDIVSEKDFQDEKCRDILKEMQKLKVFDFNLLRNSFRDRNRDIYDFLLSVFSDYQGIPQNIQYYAKTIKEESKKRELIQTTEKMKYLLSSGSSVSEILEIADNDFLKLLGRDSVGFSSAKETAIEFMERQVKAKEEKKEISGMTTGFRCIDLSTDGMRDGEMVLICARPSIGKTALLTHIADHVATKLGKNVAIFSIETFKNAIFTRMLSQRARIESRKIRTGNLTQDEEAIMLMHIDDLAERNIFINDMRPISIPKMKAQIKKLIAIGHKPDIIFVDYLQIIDLPKEGDSEASKIGALAIGLKEIAKNMNIPMVALAQVNRSVADEEPNTYSIKGSGTLEQEADQIWLLHRPEQYLKDKCPENMKNKILIIQGKNREAGIVNLELNWEGRYTRIYE